MVQKYSDGVIELHNRLLWRDQEFIQLSILCHTSYYYYFEFPNCSFTSETSMRPLFLTAKGNLRRWHCVENHHTLDMYPNRNIHEASVAPCANCVILTASSLLSQMTNIKTGTPSVWIIKCERLAVGFLSRRHVWAVDDVRRNSRGRSEQNMFRVYCEVILRNLGFKMVCFPF